MGTVLDDQLFGAYAYGLESPIRREIYQKSNSKSMRCALKSVRTPAAYLFLGSLFEREINQKLKFKINRALR